MKLLFIIDIVLFIVFAINSIYLFVFSLASMLRNKFNPSKASIEKRIAILIPAYKEDSVIMECVKSCLNQNYSKHCYDTVVISDQMSESTNYALETLPVKLIKVHFENSTKAKALNFAMEQIGDNYDIAIILDADNVIASEFLNEINNAINTPGVEIVQAHRCAKNINTPLALLDAVSEEINNSIFRKGHANVGLSAALIGSGMAFDYRLFKKTMLEIDAIGGFDRALELVLLRQGKRFYYLPESDVLDEKVQQSDDFSRQRRRWLSAQLHYLNRTIKYLPSALLHGKWDFCDKIFQQMSIPRVMLIGFCFIFAALWSVVDFCTAVKWWGIFAMLIATFAIAAPSRLMGVKFINAVIQLPYFFAIMVVNIFRLKGANKKFIHTKHGVK